MKPLKASLIAKLISDEYFKMNLETSRVIENSFKRVKPKNKIQREILGFIKENRALSKKNLTPLCQDTGVLTIFLELKEPFCIEGDIAEQTERALFETTKKRGLRFSTVSSKGEFSNKPVLHIIQSKRSRIVLLAKGGGSENLTRLKMFSPSAKREDIAEFAIEAAKEAKDRGCPPYILAIGSGRSAEESVFLSKMALTGKFKDNKSEEEKEIQKIVMKRSKELKTGILGFHFGETVADCRVILRERHIATLPVCVTFNCFQERVREILL